MPKMINKYHVDYVYCVLINQVFLTCFLNVPNSRFLQLLIYLKSNLLSWLYCNTIFLLVVKDISAIFRTDVTPFLVCKNAEESMIGAGQALLSLPRPSVCTPLCRLENVENVFIHNTTFPFIYSFTIFTNVN